MSESYFIVALCPISFSFHLQPTILFPFISWALWMLLKCIFVGVGVSTCFPWSAGFSNALGLEPPHDIMCPILWFQGILTILPINALVAYLPPVAYKGCFTIIALLFLVYRVLDNGLFGFSLVLLHCSLIFHITDYEANEAHFQRLLSKHWPAFTCWSFLPYRVVCSCFYFAVLPLAIL